MPSPNPPSELPAVQAEGKLPDWFVRGMIDKLPPFEVQWDHETQKGWFSAMSAVCDALRRLSESPSAPTKFPMCAVHSFVTTDVCGCARRDAPSAPTHAGEMPGCVQYAVGLLEAFAREIEAKRQFGADVVRRTVADIRAHYAQPKPTGMTREVEELVRVAEAMHRQMKDAGLALTGSRVEDSIAAVRSAGGGA